MREPLQDGVRLATMTDGVEGQVWREGALVATRWWPAPPPVREWVVFLRAAGADLSQPLSAQPASVDSPLLNVPWTSASAPITDFWSLIQNDRAAAIAAAVLAAPFLYLFGEASVLGIAETRLNVAMANLSQANQSIRMERSDALADLGTIQRYLTLEPYPPQFQVMATAAGLLRDKKLSISEWSYDSGNLEFVIHGDNPLDATFYIEAFEGNPTFANVSATSENQEHDLRLRMQVNPKSSTPS
ncbi:MAG: hypothetical protein EPO08_15210 [Rhodospirillaceae bacterium]|nr:MAG: hypothetical protein EPO08_15210 [Rhodospirillaceae bacterium]